MLEEITWVQFEEWLTYEAIEPFGEKRGDWQAATVCATIMNAMLARSRSRKAVRASDFLLQFKDKETALTAEQPQRQPWETQKFYARAFAAAANADEKKKTERAAKRAARPRREKPPRKPTRAELDKVRQALKRG